MKGGVPLTSQKEKKKSILKVRTNKRQHIKTTLQPVVDLFSFASPLIVGICLININQYLILVEIFLPIIFKNTKFTKYVLSVFF